MTTTEGDGGSDDDDEADTPLHELLTSSRLRPVKPTTTASASASGVYTDNNGGTGAVGGVGAMPGKGGDLSTKPVTDYVI